MKIRIKEDSVVISGYVNAVERISKRLCEKGEIFYEKIKEGAFSDAISRNDNIKLLLNHKYERELATKGSNLTIFEDSIGLFAEAVVTDKEVIDKARNRELVGWSFGFIPLKTDDSTEYMGEKLRNVECLNLYEVSILDNNHIPAYNSMSLNVRGLTNDVLEIRSQNNLEIEELDNREFDNSFFVAKIDNFINERNKK